MDDLPATASVGGDRARFRSRGSAQDVRYRFVAVAGPCADPSS